MGLRRRSRTGSTDGSHGTVELAEDVYVVSPRAAELAADAQREERRAAEAERAAAEVAEAALVGDKKALKAAKKRHKNEKKRKKKDADAEPDVTGTAADPLTGAKVKRYIGIARIVIPVAAPLVYQAVGAARARYDTHRARQLGVAPDELGDFTGRGAALYARIHNIGVSSRDLRARQDERSAGDTARDAEVRSFTDDTDARLADLEAAVRAAEQMPAARRRSAHLAVAGELDRIESRLLTLWGVGGGPRPTR